MEDRPETASALVTEAVAETTAAMEGLGAWMAGPGLNAALWIGAALLLTVVLRTIRKLIASRLPKPGPKDHALPNLVGLPREIVARTSSLFLLAISMIITAPFLLPIADGLWLRRAVIIVGIVQLAMWAKVIARAVLTGVVARTVGDRSAYQSASNLIGLLVNTLISAIAFLTILANLNVDITALVAGLGVGGIAIGLAAQNIFKDLFASLSILLDRPFEQGDYIEFGSRGGVVERIGLRSTRFRTLSGQQLSVSNDNLLSNHIDNYKRMTERRVVLTLGVTYQAPRAGLEALPDRLSALIGGRAQCRFDRAHLSGFGDSAITFEVVYHVLSPDYVMFRDEHQDVLLDIHRAFEDLGLDFAYPTRTLHVESMAVTRVPAGSDRVS